MKKILIAVLAVVVSSCYDLDTKPYDKVSSGSFWKTEAHALQGVLGVYADMKDHQLFGLFNMFDNGSDIGVGYDPQGLGDIINGNFTDRTGLIVNRWRRGFDGIQRANTVIRNVSQMDIAAETKSVVIGEARFLRAFFYFHLLNCMAEYPSTTKRLI